MSGERKGSLSTPRVLGGAVLVVVLVTLVLRLGAMLEKEPEESWQHQMVETRRSTGAGSASAEHPRLSVKGVEPQEVHIEVDGEVFFSGRLKGGETLEAPPGETVSVQLDDLTRAVVIYNGSRVVPLGRLTAGRRLVFIDDSGQ